MLRMLGKLLATWLTAFAIAGTTVWAGLDDDPSEPEAGAGNQISGVEASPAAMRPDAAD